MFALSLFFLPLKGECVLHVALKLFCRSFCDRCEELSLYFINEFFCDDSIDSSISYRLNKVIEGEREERDSMFSVVCFVRHVP